MAWRSLIALPLSASGAVLHFLGQEAISAGAVCLDGSPPAYYLRAGRGENASKWFVYHEGGGWCGCTPGTDVECFVRAYGEPIESGTPPGYLGSSKDLKDGAPPRGLDMGFLSNDTAKNPELAGWTLVFLHYCDGASFSGNAEEPRSVQGKPLYYRGRRVLEALADDVLSRGLQNASEVIVGGTSAGGLSAFLHLDYWRTRIPARIPIKGIADAGFFLNHASVDGHDAYPSRIRQLLDLQNSTGSLNFKCRAEHKGEEWQCFFAEVATQYLQTPVFAIQSRFDSWQMANIFNLSNQSAQLIEAYGDAQERAMSPLVGKHGHYLEACRTHGTCFEGYWKGVQIGSTEAHSAFWLWYTGRHNGSFVDCHHVGCNPTCPAGIRTVVI